MLSSTRTSVAVDEVFDGTFECSACGYEAPASVRSRAKLISRGKTAEAREAAEAAAEEVAGAVASRTLMFMRCPRCGKRDSKARAYQVQVVLGALAMGAAGFALMFVALMKTRADRYLGAFTPWLAVACGLTWAARTFIVYRRAWHDVDRRVTLRAP